MTTIHDRLTGPASLAGLVAFVILVSTPEARADGIPFNRERMEITAPHTIFTMTAAQVEEADALRTLTLTPEQWAVMRKKTPGYPKRLTVVTHKYNDCTCGLTGYLSIWLPGNRIGVLDRVHRGPEFWVKYNLEQRDYLSLTMDGRGQFYMDGMLVPYPALKGELKAEVERRKTSEKDEKEKDLVLGVGLPAGMTRESVTLASRVAEISEMVEGAGGRVWVQ